MNLNGRSYVAPIRADSPFSVAFVVGVAALFSYLAAKLGGSLVIRPEMIWPLWPGCALIVAMLLLTPRKIWPAILAAGLAGFAVYDRHETLPIRAILFLLVADCIEILVAALGVSYVFGGTPRLNSVKALAKYSLFAIVLAPISAASVAALALEGDSWWVAFFTEALALLTLTPAILGWGGIVLGREKKPKADYLEALLICIGLATSAYFAFVASVTESRPIWLYALVPFLLWAAFRFGITGASSSMVVVSFLAIVGAVRGRGPFTGNTPLHNVLSLQLFLLVAAASFMVLAALVEERGAAAESIRESEKRFKLVADNAPVLIWMSATDKLCTYFNKPWLDFTGRSLEQEQGNGWAEGVHRDDLQRCLAIYTQSFDDRKDFQMEYRLRRNDGEYRWIFDVGVPRYNPDGSFTGYIGSCIDVTDRKRAEEARFRHAAIVESSQDAIITQNLDAVIVSWNAGAQRLFGYTEAEAVGKPITIVMPPDLIDEEDEIRDKLRSGGRIEHHETVRVTRTGKRVDVSLIVGPVKDSNGNVIGFSRIAHDITQRKQMEKEVADVSRKLIQSQEQERARIGRELHDDINQRLALFAVELDQLKGDSSQIEDRVRALQRQAAELSNDVQALSHELHSSKLDYLGVVTGIRSWCREFSERQRMEIEFKADVASTIPSEIGVTLFRILQEAFHNAVKHSGVKRIEVRLDEQSDDIHLDIRDAGRGFDVGAARQGRGVGLASMDERVRLVRGTITIDSQLARGTHIHVRIPLTSDRTSRRAAG